MRTDKALRELVDTSLKVCGGAMPLIIVAEDKAESDAIWALLKGRRGGKSITVRLAKHPDEFVPLMDLVRRKSERMAAKPAEPEELDYDGY